MLERGLYFKDRGLIRKASRLIFIQAGAGRSLKKLIHLSTGC